METYILGKIILPMYMDFITFQERKIENTLNVQW